MTKLEQYRQAVLQKTGWFTRFELEKELRYLDDKCEKHSDRIKNAIHHLKAQGLIEVSENRPNYRSQGQSYRVRR